MNGIIYYLADPREPEHIRYVGVTSRDEIKERLWEHMREINCKKPLTHKINWIRKLHKENISPIIHQLQDYQDVEEEILFQEEIFYIKFFKDLGHKLVNTTTGGKGTFGHTLSPEAIEKIRASSSQQWKNLSQEKKEELILIGRKRMMGNSLRTGKKDPEHRLISKRIEMKGKNSPTWKGYLIQMNDNFEEIDRWESIQDAAEKYNIGYQAIWSATWKKTKEGVPYKSVGFYWKYELKENI